MFSTSSLYFLVAIFGETIETGEAHGIQFAEGQAEETMESTQNESQGEVQSETHNESTESQEQRLQEEQAEQNASESKHVEGEETEEIHEETSENQRRIFEFPLSVSTGVGYAAIGLWMILDKRNSKIPYIIAIVGSIILLGIYIASRTVGISNLGIEAVGLLDVIVGVLQGGTIVGSSYILLNKIYAKGMTVG